MDDLESFQVLSFDCYGTLIDWETGIRTELRRWATQNNVSATDDELLAHFARLESTVQRETTPAPLYPQILKETLDGHFGLDYTYGRALGEHAGLLLYLFLQ